MTLLQNKDLIVHPTQRIVCIYFLYDMYRSDHISSNPFASVFIHLIVLYFLKLVSLYKINIYKYSKNKNPPNNSQNGNLKEFNWSIPRLTPQEKYLVSQLITSPSKDVFILLYLHCSNRLFNIFFILQLFKKTANQILQMDTSSLNVKNINF